MPDDKTSEKRIDWNACDKDRVGKIAYGSQLARLDSIQFITSRAKFYARQYNEQVGVNS
jgi:hypothetical protein